MLRKLSVLILLCAMGQSVFAYSAYEGGVYPPVSATLNPDIQVVLSARQKRIYKYRPVWVILPTLSIRDVNKSAGDGYAIFQLYETTTDTRGADVHRLVSEFSTVLNQIPTDEASISKINNTLNSFLTGSSAATTTTAIATNTDNATGATSTASTADTINFRPVVTDASVLLVSMLSRSITDDRLNLTMLTKDVVGENDDVERVINGIELGIRLNNRYSVQVRFANELTTPNSLGFIYYPSENSSISISHSIQEADDNETDRRLGVEFKWGVPSIQ
ncbi:hypothetical protein RsTz2092_08080 [Deferribacterales bacterium RsTz2092]|nr:hypothetical protein AGMMS49941_08700 [Deferribacterales bacterium]